MALASSLPSISPNQLLFASDDFATGVVITGKSKSYFFPPGTNITRWSSDLVVRGYNSVFVFPASATVRTLSSPAITNVASLPSESNGAMLSALASYKSSGATLANNACIDCVLPELANYTDNLTLSAPVPVAPTTFSKTAYACFDDPTAGNACNISSMPQTTITGTGAQMIFDPSVVCLQGGYEYETQSGECWPIGTGQAISPLILSGWARDYTWGYLNALTKLTAGTPVRNQTELWGAEYFNIYGQKTSGGGTINIGNQLVQYLYCWPTFTSNSTMYETYYFANGKFAGYSQGIMARWTPFG